MPYHRIIPALSVFKNGVWEYSSMDMILGTSTNRYWTSTPSPLLTTQALDFLSVPAIGPDNTNWKSKYYKRPALAYLNPIHHAYACMMP